MDVIFRFINDRAAIDFTKNVITVLFEKTGSANIAFQIEGSKVYLSIPDAYKQVLNTVAFNGLLSKSRWKAKFVSNDCEMAQSDQTKCATAF